VQNALNFLKKIGEDVDRNKYHTRAISDCLQNLTQNLEPSETAAFLSNPGIHDVFLETLKRIVHYVLVVTLIPEIKEENDGAVRLYDVSREIYGVLPAHT
jgi:hypothetical protein